MDKPMIDTATVYGIVADALPMEGRDFTIDAAYDENRNPRLVVKPLTDLGRKFVPVIISRLEKPMGRNGVSVGEDGTVAQEILTINSLREKAEREADAATQAKIKAAEEDHKTKYQASQEARKARIAKEGENSELSHEEREANRAANDASALSWKLKRIAAKIPDIRKEIDSAARNAAIADEKNGKFWAVDMNAPLTSLFDQQDVASKFRSKEDLIRQLAAKAFEMDDLRERAVMNAKQYIIQK